MSAICTLSMWIFLASILILALRVSAQQCFYGRDQLADSDYVPCSNDTDVVSACCLKGDCIGNQTNICWNRDTGITYVASCTDSAFSNDALCGGLQCGKGPCRPPWVSGRCETWTDQRADTQFIGLAKCGSGWRCCDGKGQRGDKPANVPRAPCPSCDPQNGFPSGTIAPAPAAESTQFLSTTTSSSTLVAVTTSSTSDGGAVGTSTVSTSAPLSTGSASDGQAPASSVSLKVGLGVGLPLGAAAIGLAALVFILLRRRRPREDPHDPSADGSTAIWRGEVHAGPSVANTPHMTSPHTQSSMHFSSPPQSVLSSPNLGAPDASPSLPPPYHEK